MIDNLSPCDIGAFVTIQEAIMRFRTIGLQFDAAEELGSDSLWVTEHHFRYFGGMLPNPQRWFKYPIQI